MPGGFPILNEACHGTDQATDTANSRGTTLALTFAWQQLIASTPFDASLIVVQADYDFSNSWGSIGDIGIGAAGSEIPFITKLFLYSNGSWIFPVTIPAGTRIAYQAVSELGSKWSIHLFETNYGSEGAAGVDAIGYDGAQPGGTAVQPSATANTKGSWTQLIAATAIDYHGFYVSLHFCTGGSTSNPANTTGKFTLTDIAIGGAGSEVVIVPNILWSRSTLATNAMVFYPIFIPAGTRISARMQCNAASGSQNNILIYGLYK